MGLNGSNKRSLDGTSIPGRGCANLRDSPQVSCSGGLLVSGLRARCLCVRQHNGRIRCCLLKVLHKVLGFNCLKRREVTRTQLLRQVSGVGPVTALAYVLTLETPLRFARSRDVGPYLGLVPKQEDSGDIQPQLGISKAGDRIHWRVLASREQGAWGGLRGGRIRWKTSNLSMKMVSKTGLNR
jgi:transposase